MDTEETIETTEEEETLDETKPQEESEDSSKESDDSPKTSDDSSDKTSLEEKNKRLYARMKKAEEEVKALKDAISKGKIPANQDKSVFDLAKAVSSLKDYSPEELDFIQMISNSKNISPEEAAQTEEAKLYIAARRKKVEDEKSKLEPSTKQSPTEKSVDDVTPQDLRNMPISEKEEFLAKLGWVNKPFKRKS